MRIDWYKIKEKETKRNQCSSKQDSPDYGMSCRQLDADAIAGHRGEIELKPTHSIEVSGTSGPKQLCLSRGRYTSIWINHEDLQIEQSG